MLAVLENPAERIQTWARRGGAPMGIGRNNREAIETVALHNDSSHSRLLLSTTRLDKRCSRQDIIDLL
ncbi:hypothetical protein GJ744_005714 [Endocarpon pusillum]|uniref:Uncharacterized protein n=1 Tax=Endocarpon pusillum TaxID=364733 RepID=A0A8H7AMH6_9EURO|nr:hypothetical protein GJ744_005714 [Endocarpon pusillum]